jgi:tetratricopeptide (TPR) repeat protein
VLRDHRRDQAGVRRLIEIARLADPDPWRDRLREVRQLGPRDARLAGLKELAASAPVDQLPAVSLHLLGRALLGLGASSEAELLLRRGVRRYADDVWINYELARCLERLAHREEAIRYYVAARALRLEFSHPLAHALEQTGETDRAIAVLEDLVRARPRDGRHLTCLGKALMDRDRDREGREALDAAISALRAEIARQPGRADLYVSLGLALLTEQRPGEAIPELRTAIRLKPDYPEAHFILARALRSRGGSDEPIAEYREALRLRPDYADAHNNLGNILRAQGDSDGAIAEYRDALRIDRDLPHAHYNLGNVLDDRGQQAEAIAEYRTALRLKPDYPEAHVNLGGILHTRGDLEEAIAEYRAAIRLRPGLVEAHNNLARALRARGEYPEAIAILRKACDMARRMAHPLAQQFQRELAITERFASLAARLPAIMAGEAKAADTTEAIDFARLCSDRGMQGTSTRLWSKAFQSQARLMEDMQAQHRYNAACTAALAGCGQGRDDPPLDNAARARWRKQAIDWLKADLAAWTKILESGPPQAKQAIMQTLRHWKVDTDLAGLRDPASLTKLAKDEQEACHALWEAVDALIAKASGNPR